MQTIAVVFGSRSAEHDVSIITAVGSVIKPLEATKKYRVEAIYIAKDGTWYWDEKLKDISLYTSGNIQDFIHKANPVSVQFDGGLSLIKASGIAGRKIIRKVDIVFPATHGTFGEDGALMGLLEMANVPFVGCDLPSSVVAMDKVLSKQVASAHNISVTKFLYFSRSELERNPKVAIQKIKKDLLFPVFIKPAHLGSSIGITRAGDEAGLNNGLELAAHYDNKIIVEEAVNNLIEVTVPVMGNENPKAALVERPLTTSDDFFDFDTKYLQGGKKTGGPKGAQGYSELPAKLEDDLYKRCEELAIEVYKAIGCSGIARVDLLIDRQSKEVYFNELNPLPGSLYAHNWRAAGVSTVELVESLIRFAVERWQQRQSLTTTFNTNYLRQF